MPIPRAVPRRKALLNVYEQYALTLRLPHEAAVRATHQLDGGAAYAPLERREALDGADHTALRLVVAPREGHVLRRLTRRRLAGRRGSC
eukprot:scaffold22617_cov66-Phaeocystis_antarctica.AAC.7